MSEETKEAFANCLQVAQNNDQQLAALRLSDAWSERLQLVEQERDEAYEALNQAE